jgi:hypothetical protein
MNVIDKIIKVLNSKTLKPFWMNQPSHECLWGPVNEKGYQHCTLCGKAQGLPHQHKYEIIDILNYNKTSSWDNSVYPVKVYIVQCDTCGDIKKVNITA